MSGQVEYPLPMSVEALLEVFPEWRAVASREVDEWGSEYVVVYVEAPPEADVQRGLRIDTADDEVTVAFDFYHEHFDDWAGQSGPGETQSALQFVQQIVEERVAVVSWWRDDQWAGSSVTEAGVPPEPPESRTWTVPPNRVRVRSWSGTFNLDGDAGETTV
jgi:hypothetical protein